MSGLTRRATLALAGGAAAFGGLARAQTGAGAASAATSAQARSQGIQYIELNGTRLGYERHSRGDARPPMVFVHGYSLRSTGPVYTPLIERLTTDFDVYALDLRGHGASASSFADWSQSAIADDVAAFANRLDLRGAVYAGHSLGGFTGLYAQIRHPGTFSALALLATAVASGGTPVPGLEDAFATRGKDRTFLEGAVSSMYVRPRPDDIRNAVDAVSLMDPRVHRAFFPRYPSTIITDQLAEVTVPVLLLNGAKDNVVPPTDQHRTAAGLSRGKDVTFSSEGHMLPIEIPERTAREMLSFFRHDVAEA